MIVLDTTVLVYAVGADHLLRDPCRRVVQAARDGRIVATTTVEVVQEFVHVRSRRTDKAEAARRGREYATLLGPLVTTMAEDLERGLRLFERHAELGCFDAVLAATALNRGAERLISADAGFGAIRGLAYVSPAGRELDQLFGASS